MDNLWFFVLTVMVYSATWYYVSLYFYDIVGTHNTNKYYGLKVPISTWLKRFAVVALLAMPINIDGNVFTVIGNAKAEKSIYSVASVYQNAGKNAVAFISAPVIFQKAGGWAFTFLGITFQNAEHDANMGLGISIRQTAGDDAMLIVGISLYQQAGRDAVAIGGISVYQMAKEGAVLAVGLSGYQNARDTLMLGGISGYQKAIGNTISGMGISIYQNAGNIALTGIGVSVYQKAHENVNTALGLGIYQAVSDKQRVFGVLFPLKRTTN